MKQKYTILRDDEKDEMVIKEFAELDKEMLSFLCEQTYSRDDIKSAVAKGKASVIDAIRTRNMYPPFLYADRIAESVIALYASDDKKSNNQSADIFFDDFEFLTKEEEETEPETEEDAEDIDNLLEDNDIESGFTGKEEAVAPISSSLKIADDESLDVEEE